MDILVVVDMQKDFISGALGTKEAVGIVPRVAEKIVQAKKAGKTIVFTRDTHHENYLDTQEGKNLPVPHCIENTDGWQIDPALDTAGARIFDKPSFGSEALVRYLKKPAGFTVCRIRRPVHRHLRHHKRAFCQVRPPRASHLGRQRLLRRCHAPEPRKRPQRHAHVPDQN